MGEDGFAQYKCRAETASREEVASYKLNVVIKDNTGRAKIFMFGGVAEQVVRRIAADLVEESSSNQILLPSPLRALIGRRTPLGKRSRSTSKELFSAKKGKASARAIKL
ncbi:hypothetical protein E2562_020397 [Oryza meyeriana var. granulata]|uniref:Replication factor A C-terminal domain-containing protein n=1 Tax=Oryza meyeriana var. granulata TaxID=110450 RepID=A0A6G1DNF9_9ORYZ|nr:hypothetical protein E2562_020397 [Oryza meyeriana var. granulata]